MTLYNQQVDADRSSSEHPDKEEDLVMEFGNGVDLKHPPHKVPEGYVQRALNMYYPYEGGIPTTRPGFDVLVNNTGSNTQVTAVHVFRKDETTSFTCFTMIDGAYQSLWYLDGTDTPVQITSSIGGLATPCMVTYDNSLIVAVPGYWMGEWQGFTTPGGTRGQATIGFTGLPANDDTLTIGDEVWIWKTATTAVPPFQINIGATPEECAANLTAAINTDSCIVGANANDPADEYSDIYARRVGVAGDLTIDVSDSANTNKSGNMSGGADGLYYDNISTYQAPKPWFLCVDQNLRLVAAGDQDYKDRVYFSAPQDHWQWATGVYGGGETFDLGCGDGTDITAIHPMLTQLVVHKSGQGRHIYRIDTSDPDPTTWTSAPKGFSANTSAINFRSCASVTDKHVFLDSYGFSVLTGTDTYDEVVARMAGGMVGPKLTGASKDYAFLVVNPDELYVAVFPTKGRHAWVFHYGSARWTEWEFAFEWTITCATYDAARRTIIIGCLDSKILVMDSTVFTDNGVAYPSEIVTRALGDGKLQHTLVKQTLIDWKNIASGTGSVSLEINNTIWPDQDLFSFTIDDSGMLLADTDADLGGEDLILEDATMPLLTTQYGRVNSFNQGGGELVALKIRLDSGAWALHGVTLRVAYHGRVAQ